MVPAIAVLTSTAHAFFLLVFGVLWFAVVPSPDAANGGFKCAAALHYDIFMVGLLACFGLMLVLELALIYAGMKGNFFLLSFSFLSIAVAPNWGLAIFLPFVAEPVPSFSTPKHTQAPPSRSPSGGP